MRTKNTVELVGHYGGDETHACSAWTSTSRELTPEKRARIPEMLKKLADAGHHTPFEKSSLHFLITGDVASHIHKLKHRIAVSINAESARYKELREDRFYIPSDWPMQWQVELEKYTAEGLRLYHNALKSLTEDHGMTRKRAKETARYFRGYNTMIESDVMFNFRSFVHFQRLRNDDHAQDEIHWMAQEMLNLVATIPGNPFKETIKAFNLKPTI